MYRLINNFMCILSICHNSRYCTCLLRGMQKRSVSMIILSMLFIRDVDMSPALAGGFLKTEQPGKPKYISFSMELLRESALGSISFLFFFFFLFLFYSCYSNPYIFFFCLISVVLFFPSLLTWKDIDLRPYFF